MKTAYLCADPGIPVYGQKGCSRHVQEMLRAFESYGANIHLFAYRWGEHDVDSKRNVIRIGLPALGKVKGSEREQHLLDNNTAIERLLIDHGPFELVYERYALWSHAGLAAAKTMGARTVLEVNAPLIEEQQSFRELHARQAAIISTKRAFDAADVIVAVSDEVAGYINQFEEAHGKVHVIPNGVDAERFPNRLPAGTSHSRPFTVGFVGTLKPWHGVDLLLRAFAELVDQQRSAQLLIVGDGPERENLYALADALGISTAVEFTGAVSPAHIPALLSRMDVGVAPYPAMQNFYFSPLKILEYMAAGLPVVASRIGQITQLVEHGRDGLLVECGDIAALTEALHRLHRSTALGHRFGRTGQEKVRRQHTWQAVAERVLHAAGLHQLPSSRVSAGG